MFKAGAIATGGTTIPSDKLSFTKENCGWVDVWELILEVLGPFRLMASAIFGEIVLAEALCGRRRRTVPSFE
jgi:hypothetical protein